MNDGGRKVGDPRTGPGAELQEDPFADSPALPIGNRTRMGADPFGPAQVPPQMPIHSRMLEICQAPVEFPQGPAETLER